MTGSEHLLERVRAATSDEYVIDREIGRGGMAAVFLGRDIALDRRVAIKVMLPDLVNVQGVADRFLIEARTAAHLDHPGIVTVYAVKQRADLLFIVMKYIEGHTLEAVLRSQGQIDPTAVALIGGRVAEALLFAHGEGVVHRDVKPSNIIIDPRGRPVVTDFGIARVLTAQSITVAGSMLGTPTHMSPEQCRGLPATAASDQYSLGVTMYEMLTGRAPFVGSLFELIAAHREQSPPPLSEFVAGVDASLEHTVMRMLSKDPQDRWPSLTEVVARLAAQTTVNQGTDSFRATLVLTGTDSLPYPTPASPSPLPSPPPVSPPPMSPVPVSAPQPAAASTPEAASPLEPATTGRGTGRRGLLIGGGALAVVAAVTFAVVSSGRGTAAPPPSVKADSMPPVAQATAAPSVAVPSVATLDSMRRDSVARDSVARDSAAKALAATADSVRRDSVAKATAAKASAAKASAVRPARDSARPPRVRPESIAVECARLLERASLGERLTDAERRLLRQRCPK